MAQCDFPNCTVELPEQSGRGQPRTYCSASHRVVASRARRTAELELADRELERLELAELAARRRRRTSWMSTPSRSRGRLATWWSTSGRW